MKKVKGFFFEKLSSVWYMWFAFGFGFIAFLMMFAPAFYNNLIGYRPVTAAEVFWPSGSGLIKGAWPAFMGYLFVIIGFVATGVMALPFVQPSAKVEKIVLISAAALELVGLFLASFIMLEYYGINGAQGFVYSSSYLCGGTISFIIFDVLTILCTSIAVILDW